MSDFDVVVLVPCFLLGMVGGLWFLYVAFRESAIWGIGCMGLPFVSLFFLILHFNKAWKPFLVKFAGVGTCVVWVVMTEPMNPPSRSAPYEVMPAASTPREVAPKPVAGKKPAKKTRRVTTWESVPNQ